MISFLEFLDESMQQSVKRSKESEVELAKQSPIYQKTSYQGWSFEASVHAAAQAYDRRPDLDFDQWKKLHRNAVTGLLKDKSAKTGDYIFFSKSLDQGYVAHVDVKRKTFKIITVLPKGRKNPMPGTEVLIVEGKEISIISTIVVD